MKKLSVNLDHVATLREARKEPFPDPVKASLLVELGGGDGITVHIRQDRRHIKERDLMLLREVVHSELNIEMAAEEEMIKIAKKVKPDIVTLVPEKPEELTTEGGLDVINNEKRIKYTVEALKSEGILVSIFVEPDITQINKVKEIGADRIEINTDKFSKNWKKDRYILEQLKNIAHESNLLDLKIHAGHGLNYENISLLLENVKEIEGFSIGFAIVARAIYVGLKEATREMKRLIEFYSKKEVS